MSLETILPPDFTVWMASKGVRSLPFYVAGGGDHVFGVAAYLDQFRNVWDCFENIAVFAVGDKHQLL